MGPIGKSSKFLLPVKSFWGKILKNDAGRKERERGKLLVT